MAESDEDSDVEYFFNRLRTLHPSLSGMSPNDIHQKLQGLVTNIHWSPAEATGLSNALLKRFDSTAKDRSYLLSWMMKMLHRVEINYITPGWRSQNKKTLVELVRDEAVTDEDLEKRLADDKEKQLDEILEEIRQQKLNQIDESLLAEVRDIVSSVEPLVKDPTLHTDATQLSDLKEVLLKICLAAKKPHFVPRRTQMVSWCIMALSKTGRLIQVGTGEGKSCIVAMFAAFRAMRGEKVDVMSSSSVLAKRDLDEWRGFYGNLKISVDSNIDKPYEKLKRCHECQVVYGTVHDFAADWLKHYFYRKDIFGQRAFQCAIVDEADSLMLDKGLQTVYLSSNMPALQHLNLLLALIWTTVNQYREIGTETIVGRQHPFHQVMLENITKHKDIDQFTILQMAEDAGVLAKGSVKDLRKNLSLLTEKTKNVTANQLAKFFETAEKRFPSCQFALHCINGGSVEELNKRPQKETANQRRVPLLLINGGFCQYMYPDTESVLGAAEAEIKGALHFTPCELSKDGLTCYIPGFLSHLVDSQLKVWIQNAFRAKTMTKDHEYVVETNEKVVPVDYSCTGVVENNMEWSDGLHQFIEMKHGSKLSDMAAITNYMSNVGLLQKYGSQIYGISGTLGQQAETETLQKVYGDIKTCQIPSFKRRKLFEVEGVITVTEDEWIETTCDAITAQTNLTPYRDGRAVLVICETIQRAKVLHQALGKKVQKKQLYISNNMDNTAIFAKELEAGEVIIATNLAGRGTDLQVSDQVKTAGGLFVVQTFLPMNARVEAQAFGRTARQGSPGSAQLIVCANHLSEPLKMMALMGNLPSSVMNMINVLPHLFVMQLRSYQKGHGHEQSDRMSSTLSESLTANSNLGMKTVKKVRDDLVAERLASYLESDIPKIKEKEELFNEYLETLDELYRISNNKPEDSDLSALNEFWGMWLITNYNETDSITDFKCKLHEDLETARQKLRQRESPLSNLHHYTAFGNDLRKKGQHADSIKMYTKAIQEDHCWAAIAYYNRAVASLTKQGKYQDLHCINEVLGDLQNALKSVELYCEQIEATQRYATQVKDLHSEQVTGFDGHMKTRRDVFLCFKEKIGEAIKKVEQARDLNGTLKVKEMSIYFLPPGECFLALPLANSPTSYRELLRAIRVVIRHPFCVVNELRFLESLGLTQFYTLDIEFSFLSRIRRTMKL